MQKTVPYAVMVPRRITVVCRAIQLNRQPSTWTVEIQNVTSHAMLTANFCTHQLTALQILPKTCFRGSQVVPELATTGLEPLKVVQAHVLKTF